MTNQFPALIIMIPLLAAFFIAVAGWLNQKFCFPIAILALGAALCISIGLLLQVSIQQLIVYRMGGWEPPWGITYNIDHLNALVLVVVAAVAFINLIATYRSAVAEFSDRIGLFYTLYMLFVTGLLGILITGDAFNLYVLLEIASLTGYALIGMGRQRAPLAGLNYIFIGTIGASFYLLGIGYLYLITGSLNMVDIAEMLTELYSSRVVLFAFIICMAGLFVKMALFPFHAWLPNAYAYSPSAAVSLIAPLTTKVMIYVMIRITLSVFTPAYVFSHLNISSVFIWMAVGAMVMGSLLALSQKSLRKMLAYVVVAEVGYMVGGLWLGNRAGISGAILHVLNDALMTLCVFLAAGSIAYKLKADSFDDFKGLFRKMPLTMASLVAGGLSIIGIPPTCGFFSKWYLISGGISAGRYGFVAALLFSSLVNMVLFFKIFEIAYFEPFVDRHGHNKLSARNETIDEAPIGMLMPLMIVAVALLAVGLYNGDIVTRIIDLAIPESIP